MQVHVKLTKSARRVRAGLSGSEQPTRSLCRYVKDANYMPPETLFQQNPESPDASRGGLAWQHISSHICNASGLYNGPAHGTETLLLLSARVLSGVPPAAHRTAALSCSSASHSDLQASLALKQDAHHTRNPPTSLELECVNGCLEPGQSHNGCARFKSRARR